MEVLNEYIGLLVLGNIFIIGGLVTKLEKMNLYYERRLNEIEENLEGEIQQLQDVGSVDDPSGNF